MDFLLNCFFERNQRTIFLNTLLYKNPFAFYIMSLCRKHYVFIPRTSFSIKTVLLLSSWFFYQQGSSCSFKTQNLRDFASLISVFGATSLTSINAFLIILEDGKFPNENHSSKLWKKSSPYFTTIFFVWLHWNSLQQDLMHPKRRTHRSVWSRRPLIGVETASLTYGRNNKYISPKLTLIQCFKTST